MTALTGLFVVEPKFLNAFRGLKGLQRFRVMYTKGFELENECSLGIRLHDQALRVAEELREEVTAPDEEKALLKLEASKPSIYCKPCIYQLRV